MSTWTRSLHVLSYMIGDPVTVEQPLRERNSLACAIFHANGDLRNRRMNWIGTTLFRCSKGGLQAWKIEQ